MPKKQKTIYESELLAFMMGALTHQLKHYSPALSVEENNQCNQLLDALVSANIIPGITTWYIQVNTLSSKDENQKRNIYRMLLSGKVQNFNTLIQLYTNPMVLLQILQNAATMTTESAMDDDAETDEDTIPPLISNAVDLLIKYATEKLNTMAPKFTLPSDIENTIYRLKPTPDSRIITITRHYDIFLKRLDTMASWLCPTGLSACVAIACFNGQWVIGSNLYNARDADLLRHVISRRLSFLTQIAKIVCDEAAKVSINSRAQARLLIQTIMAANQQLFDDALGIEGFSIDVPRGFLAIEGRNNALKYLKIVLEKTFYTLCFDKKLFPAIALTTLSKAIVLLPGDLQGFYGADKKRANQSIFLPQNVASIHAEQLVVLFGENRVYVKPILNKSIGISKLCCMICANMVQSRGYQISGTSRALYPGTIDVLTLERNDKIDCDTENLAPQMDNDSDDDCERTLKHLTEEIQRPGQLNSRWVGFPGFYKPFGPSMPQQKESQAPIMTTAK